MKIDKQSKKRVVIFLFIMLYVLGFFAYLGLMSILGYNDASNSNTYSWADYLLAAVIPLISLAYPMYYSIIKKKKHEYK